jgi:phenylacetic acid degradation operon negative regulatory protein
VPSRPASAVPGASRAGRSRTGGSATEPQAGAGRQLQQLVVTICALHARGGQQPLAVSELIRLLATLDVDAAASRSALSRLKKRGVLLATRKAGSAAYRLDPALEDVFEEGDERILAPRRAKPGDRWLLAAFSVPESQRNLRHQLRRVLAGRGFGTVAAGLWIAPEFVHAHLRRELEREGLLEFVEFFAADLLDDQIERRVAEWWDLGALTELYAGFRAQFEPVLARWVAADRRADDGHADEEARAFADDVLLLTAWRRLPYLDPGLPVEFLPPGWHGIAAEQLFTALHGRLAGPAGRYAASVIRG